MSEDNSTIRFDDRSWMEINRLAVKYNLSPKKVIEKALGTYSFLDKKKTYGSVEIVKLEQLNKNGVYWEMSVDDLMILSDNEA